MLEPDDGKLSRPVLRGLSGREAAQLPGESGISSDKGVLRIYWNRV